MWFLIQQLYAPLCSPLVYGRYDYGHDDDHYDDHDDDHDDGQDDGQHAPLCSPVVYGRDDYGQIPFVSRTLGNGKLFVTIDGPNSAHLYMKAS